jgi:hypothetical protein
MDPEASCKWAVEDRLVGVLGHFLAREPRLAAEVLAEWGEAQTLGCGLCAACKRTIAGRVRFDERRVPVFRAVRRMLRGTEAGAWEQMRAIAEAASSKANTVGASVLHVRAGAVVVLVVPIAAELFARAWDVAHRSEELARRPGEAGACEGVGLRVRQYAHGVAIACADVTLWSSLPKTPLGRAIALERALRVAAAPTREPARRA